MAKQIDFVISAVRFNAEGTHIDKVKAASYDGAMFGGVTEYTREAVVEALNEKAEIFTIFGEGILGAKVITELINDVEYIKTVADDTPQDNLDELPVF